MIGYPISLSKSSTDTAGEVVKPMPVSFDSAADAAIARGVSGTSGTLLRV